MLTLCLNLINTFQVPLEKYFPEYTGGTDINKAAKYILWRFMQANRARLTVYPQYVLSYTILRPATDSHLSVAQFDPSHRHGDHPTRVCRGKGDNTPECPQRFGDPIARPLPPVASFLLVSAAFPWSNLFVCYPTLQRSKFLSVYLSRCTSCFPRNLLS